MCSGAFNLLESIRRELNDPSATANLAEYKTLIEMYSYLLHWLLETAENLWRKEKLEKESVVVKVITSSMSGDHSTAETQRKGQGASRRMGLGNAT